MQNYRAPIILAGQVYFDEVKNAYLVVTQKNGEMISYNGQGFYEGVNKAFCPGFRGKLEDEDFITKFQPVDVGDLSQDERAELLDLCPPGTVLKTGFIKEE